MQDKIVDQQNCSVVYCIPHYTVMHIYEQFLFLKMNKYNRLWVGLDIVYG